MTICVDDDFSTSSPLQREEDESVSSDDNSRCEQEDSNVKSHVTDEAADETVSGTKQVETDTGGRGCSSRDISIESSHGRVKEDDLITER